MTRPPLTAESLLAHEPFVRAVVRGLVDDDASLNDVVQETWLAALRRPPREGTSLRAWLAHVAGNRARDARRAERRRRRREEEAAVPEGLESVAAAHERLSAQRELVDAVLALDEPYRTVVFLRHWHGLAPGEIAARTGRGAGTVRSQLSRAHEILRGRLDARFDGGRAAWAALLVPLAAGTEVQASLGSAGVSGVTKLTAAAVAALAAVIVVPIVVQRVSSGRMEPEAAHSVAAAQLVTGGGSSGDEQEADARAGESATDVHAASVGGGASSVGARTSVPPVDSETAAVTAGDATRWIARVELTGAPIEDGIGSASLTYAAPYEPMLRMWPERARIIERNTARENR
jgi:RNA polymerase sigma-70 factor (ECF subfamily)